MLMRLMSKGEYLIVPKGTKFTGAGKLGLKSALLFILQSIYNAFAQIFTLFKDFFPNFQYLWVLLKSISHDFSA